MLFLLVISKHYDIFGEHLIYLNRTTKGGKKCQLIYKIMGMLARNMLCYICANLIKYLKKIILSREFLTQHRKSDKNFTRRRSLPFPTLILFLMNLIKGSIQDELDNFFKAINGMDVAVRTVTKSAFCKARKRLKYQAFIELNSELVNFFYKQFPYRRWHGFRLLAGDGSTVRTPRTKEVADHFGSWNPAKGESCPIARVSHIFDVLNKVTVHAIIGPKRKGERALLSEHLTCIEPMDLLLLDRGYPAFWLFALILSKGAHFCARVTNEHWKIIRKFYNSGKKEDFIFLSPSPPSVKQCQRMGLPLSRIKLRVTHIELDNGEVEVLITSLLDKDKYPYEIFKELYCKRWPIEEDYKTMKCRVEIENFSGKSVESVYQDFHAKIFTMNFTVALAHPTREIIEDKTNQNHHPYQINLTQALSKMKDAVVLLFKRSNIVGLISKLHNLFVKTIEPIRPNRKYPRKKGVRKRAFHPCYKPIR